MGGIGPPGRVIDDWSRHRRAPADLDYRGSSHLIILYQLLLQILHPLAPQTRRMPLSLLYPAQDFLPVFLGAQWRSHRCRRPLQVLQAAAMFSLVWLLPTDLNEVKSDLILF